MIEGLDWEQTVEISKENEKRIAQLMSNTGFSREKAIRMMLENGVERTEKFGFRKGSQRQTH
ncbi:MAG: hypothetical protein GKR96_11420 [Gammaproteobacteria bacterium]|nr:hypothetical protein [Gammaproteobacteria bacterium]